ncbi:MULTISPECIES: hypothetical protein [Cupriavidus]|uniref:Uncharacterized protein n=1 Tax=Cupriavidus pinatubonensis (strain JMP 134 / LMG 1197) TaxID=264198 RepID=Q46P58_CUPPJ|nr:MULTISPECIES: hypothetical protein [Cupriavidus]QYY29534.1 hypothetical protein K2O51_04905 [Cupriavidus pinatubonensis]TPQ40500.1 hypothetical protein C2U69_09715 [Cupriavidus pinatubonensis]
MSSVDASSSFLCTLPGVDKGIAYHVAVLFVDAAHPKGVRFTSFVGGGRRSFEVLTEVASLQGAIASSCEGLCRLAIGQAIRDHLYEKTREGDYLLDPDAAPWEGELRPVGVGATPRRPRQHFPG